MAVGSGSGAPVGGVTALEERKPYFSAVWVYDASAGAYVNNTLEAQSKAGVAFTIFEATADYLYLGSESRFDAAGFFLAVGGEITGLTWEYYKAGSWTQFIPRYEIDFTLTAMEEFDQMTTWTTLAASTSAPHSVSAVPDSLTRYWVRASASSISVSPTVNNIKCRPYAAYCSPTDVANLLQLGEDFSTTTRPTRAYVEERIHVAQSYIDYMTRKSWRINYVVEEEYEFSIVGVKLMHRDILAVSKLEVWNGGAYESKVQNRENDYFFLPDLGTIKFSRYFIIPARFSNGRGMFSQGFGEYSWPIRISYIWGRDIDRDEMHGGTITDIATKLAASDIVNNADFSVMMIMGAATDKVSLDQKIQNWKEENDEKLESMRGWVTF
jgi:hypothetical protein|tara:strand:+ start:1883 stop:3028 length:1146 start_codon:yes stop_codon:yes gene_type:complete